MALPSLNSTPSYELTVPSTKEKLKYRPFLVKEQKVLMLAYESQDKRQVINAILDTIVSCVENVNVTQLTTFDVDYIFTQIRGKSVGEKIELSINCSNCGFAIPAEVNIEGIGVNVTESEKIVKLTDDISVKLKYPSYIDFSNRIGTMSNTSQTETVMEVIISCMHSVMTEQENILLKDESKEEVMKFIESMNSQQFDAVSDFVQQMPQIEYSLDLTCGSCKHEEQKVLRGLDDFF